MVVMFDLRRHVVLLVLGSSLLLTACGSGSETEHARKRKLDTPSRTSSYGEFGVSSPVLGDEGAATRLRPESFFLRTPDGYEFQFDFESPDETRFAARAWPHRPGADEETENADAPSILRVGNPKTAVFPGVRTTPLHGNTARTDRPTPRGASVAESPPPHLPRSSPPADVGSGEFSFAVRVPVLRGADEDETTNRPSYLDTGAGPHQFAGANAGVEVVVIIVNR